MKKYIRKTIALLLFLTQLYVSVQSKELLTHNRSSGRSRRQASESVAPAGCPGSGGADELISRMVCLKDPEDTPGRPGNPTLRRYIPPGYDKYVRPPGDAGADSPLAIRFDVKARDFQRINEKDMDITIEWFVRIYWKDGNLVAPTSIPDGEWENITPDIANHIWVPTVYIDHVRSIHKPTLLIIPESIQIQNTGLIRYSISVITRLSCPMEFTAYPFDQQMCLFTLESYQFNSKHVTYSWLKEKIEQGANIKSSHFEFEFKHVPQKNSTHDGIQWPQLSIKIFLTRRLSSHVVNTYLPSGLFVSISWLTFLVPPDHIPGRMVLTITTLLTLVSMFSGVRNDAPKTSYAKAIDQWMMMCMVFVFFVLLEFTVVIKLQHLAKAIKVVSSAPMTAPASPHKSLVSQLPDKGHNDRKSRVGWITSKISPCISPQEVNLYDLWSRRLDTWTPVVLSFFFMFFNLCYWPYWLEQRKKPG